MARAPLKAQQLADQFATRIRSGEWPAGHWLPAERQLAEDEGAARSTVRRAIEVLADSGLVETVSGQGARVTRSDHALTVTFPSGSTAQGVDVVPALDGDAVSVVALLGELKAIRRELTRLGDRLTALESERAAGRGSDDT